MAEGLTLTIYDDKSQVVTEIKVDKVPTAGTYVHLPKKKYDPRRAYAAHLIGPNERRWTFAMEFLSFEGKDALIALHPALISGGPVARKKKR
jgi:hypothetical protein